MLYLLIATLLSAAFNLMMKHAHTRGYGVLAIGCLNYVTAGVAGLIWAAVQGAGAVSASAILIGCLGGCMYVACYIFILVMLERQGIALATAMTRMSIVVPIVVSVAVWRERPSAAQWAGLALTLAAMTLFDVRGLSRVGGSLWRVAWPLLGCFAAAGLSRLSQKAFGHFCSASERPLFTAAWFGFAAVVGVGILIVRRERPRGADWPFGAALGLVNIAALFCTISALARVPAIVYFPVNSVGSLILVLLLAAWVWRERLNRRTVWGMALACCALVLVNLK